MSEMQEPDAHCGGVFGGDVDDVAHESVFWCELDQLALTSTSDVLYCSTCETIMKNTGWFEFLRKEDLMIGQEN